MYKSMISHLHSIGEGPGSISGYAYEARRFGIDVVWLHDHDDQMALNWEIKSPLFTALDCSQPLTPYVELSESTRGAPQRWEFYHSSSEACFLLQAHGGRQWAGGQVELSGHKSSHRRPLLAGPSMFLTLETNITPESDARFYLELGLCQTPPDHRPNSFCYYLGQPPDNPYSFSLDERRVGTRYHVNPLQDALSLGLILDHNVGRYRFVLESRDETAWVRLKGFCLDTAALDTSAWQLGRKTISEQAEAAYGVTIINSYEFSCGQGDMCCYGPEAPIFPYTEHPNPSRQAMTRYAHMNGGITSYNHPIGEKNPLTPEKRDQIIRAKAAAMIAEQAGGAHLVEVGYPEERMQFVLRDYLTLWDLLSLGGLRVHAIGVSDAHANVGWDQGQNYANYIEAKDTRPDTLTAGLRLGRIYMADPASFQGTLEAKTDQGKTMGDTQNGGTVFLRLTDVPRDAALHWYVDGERRKTEPVSGLVDSHCSLSGSHFVRAELQRSDGRTILVTNPIWLS